MVEKIRIAVVGATGYTGSELLRLALGHPRIEIVTVAGRGKVGQPIENVLPNLAGVLPGEVVAADADAIASKAQAAFCALPHGASAALVGQLHERGVTVFDLSADFRLRDLNVYREWYGEHGAAELLPDAVYGLPELHRQAIRGSELVAVPGCYPTAAILALAPLVEAGVIDPQTILIDAKSGASGAGRGVSEITHFTLLSEGLRAYKVAGLHRHTPEIEQALGQLAGQALTVTFTPHLVPMTRGILATCYAQVRSGDAERFTRLAREKYAGSPSVTVREPGTNPDTLWVRTSNRCQIAYTVDRRTGRVIAQAVIDNLVKGAAGQALQCFNVRYGIDEGTGLMAPGTLP